MTGRNHPGREGDLQARPVPDRPGLRGQHPDDFPDDDRQEDHPGPHGHVVDRGRLEQGPDHPDRMAGQRHHLHPAAAGRGRQSSRSRSGAASVSDAARTPGGPVSHGPRGRGRPVLGADPGPADYGEVVASVAYVSDGEVDPGEVGALIAIVAGRPLTEAETGATIRNLLRHAPLLEHRRAGRAVAGRRARGDDLPVARLHRRGRSSSTESSPPRARTCAASSPSRRGDPFHAATLEAGHRGSRTPARRRGLHPAGGRAGGGLRREGVHRHGRLPHRGRDSGPASPSRSSTATDGAVFPGRAREAK